MEEGRTFQLKVKNKDFPTSLQTLGILIHTEDVEILGPRFGHLPSFPLHLLLQNLEGTNFLRIFAAKKWKEDETNKVV